MSSRAEHHDSANSLGRSIRLVRVSILMKPWLQGRRTRWLRSLGILVIAVLALASAGHFWHHLTDDCENGRQSFPHPCAQCAGFHAGVLAESIQTAGTPCVSPVIDVF